MIKLTTKSITDSQIESLKREAAGAGDTAQVIVCDIALRGPMSAATLNDEYSDIGSVSNRRELAAMTQEQAVAECVRVINDARAMQNEA